MPTAAEQAQPQAGSSFKTDPPVSTKKAEVKKICRFYSQGVCKFGKECRFEHPKYCQKFKAHGLKKFNPSYMRMRLGVGCTWNICWRFVT